MDECTKCGEGKIIHAECRDRGAKICARCFNSFCECPGCNHPDIVLM